MSARSPAHAPIFKPAPAAFLQRKCACSGTPGPDGECAASRGKRLALRCCATNRGESSEVPSIVYEVLRSPGEPLDPATRAFFEPRFGHDFSQVRVHTDTRAAESARAVKALAYTVGRDVVFGAGQYSPATAGRPLLAHELAHVVQQRSVSRDDGTLQTHVHQYHVRMGQPTDGAEREADGASRSVTQGDPAPKITSLGQSIVQRRVSTDQEIKWEADHPEGKVDVFLTGT